MSFGSLDQGGDNAPLAEINMVPLIDVMLVLLVIFLVAAPLLTHSVNIDLPTASSAPTQGKTETIEIAIDATGAHYWNGERIDAAMLETRLQTAATAAKQPEVQVRADRTVAYDHVAKLMSSAVRHGIARVGLVTDPSPR